MKIKLHKHLDKKIWDNDEHLNRVVSNMLMSIAWAYIDYIRNQYDIPIRNDDVKDIFIFGSITQLFYDKQSDIDMCIVLDFENIEKMFPNFNIEKQLKLYYYDWAMVHICKIYGRKIDLNFANVKTPEFDGQYRTGPIYSVPKQEWILTPSVPNKYEVKKIEKQSGEIYKQILRDYKTVKKNGFKLDDIEKLYANIIASKKQSVADCPTRVLNPVYMAIRKFKHDGYIKKLQEKAVQKETEKYVLK